MTNDRSRPSEATRQRAPFTPETTLADVLRTDESLAAVLMRFHIGGCSMCGFEPTDSIAKVASDNGVPVVDLLGALNSGAATNPG